MEVQGQRKSSGTTLTTQDSVQILHTDFTRGRSGTHLECMFSPLPHHRKTRHATPRGAAFVWRFTSVAALLTSSRADRSDYGACANADHRAPASHRAFRSLFVHFVTWPHGARRLGLSTHCCLSAAPPTTTHTRALLRVVSCAASCHTAPASLHIRLSPDASVPTHLPLTFYGAAVHRLKAVRRGW